MVSESEFDKNQQAFKEAQAQMQTAGPSPGTAGTYPGTAPPGMEWSDDRAEWVPIGTAGPGVVEENPFMTYNPIGLGGGFVTGGVEKAAVKGAAGAIDRGLIDDAASAVFNAIKNSGYSKAKATSGSSQVAMILKEYRNAYGSMGTQEVLKKSVDRATFLGLMRAGMESKPASKIAMKTATSFTAGKTTATIGGIAAASTAFGELLKKIGGTKATAVLTSAATIPLGMILYDFWRGNMGIDEARAQTAITMYVNGYLEQDAFEQNIRDIGYSTEVENAYIETGNDEKKNTEYFGLLGESIGIQKTSELQTSKEYASMVESYVKKQQADAYQEILKAQAEPRGMYGQLTGDLSTRPTSAIAQDDLGEKTQFLNEAQKTPKQLSRGAGALRSTFLSEETTPATEQITETGEIKPITPPAPGGFTPRFRTKSELENFLRASLTEEAWQRYIRTGVMP